MSRWDSLRPSQTEQEEQRSDGRGGARIGDKSNCHSRPDGRTSHSLPTAEQRYHPKTKFHDKNVGKSHPFAKKTRWRPRPGSSTPSSDETDIQRAVRAMRDRIRFYRQQQQQQQENAIQSNLSLTFQNLLQEIQNSTTANEATYSDICGVMVELLEMSSADTEFTVAAIRTLKQKLCYAQEKNINVLLSKEEALKAVNTLKCLLPGACSSDATTNHISWNDGCHSDALMCLVTLIKTQADRLPAEDTAQSIVLAIFLPYIQQQQSLAHEPLIDILEAACQALMVLLQNRRHASSILAPLVQDIVLKDGMESTVENPIRGEILQTMSQILVQGIRREEQSSLQIACRVLSAAVESIRALNQNPASLTTEGNHLATTLKPFLLCVLDPKSETTSTLRNESIHLLRNLLACYQTSMTPIGWKILVEEHYTYLPPFFGNTTISIDLLADFIGVLPWKRWLNQDISTKRPTTSGLFRKVVAALESMLSMARIAYQSTNAFSNPNSFVRLFKATFLELPLCDDGIRNLSTQLWQSLVTVVLDPTVSESKLLVATDTIEQSSGGYSTPLGEMVGMCQAGKLWFLEQRDVSGEFVRRLIRAVMLQEGRWELYSKLLVAVLRTLPVMAVGHWPEFCALLTVNSQGNPDIILVCLKILEAFMQGRRDFGDSALNQDKGVSSLVCTVMEITMDNCSTQADRFVLSIYSSFLDQDWKQLADNDQLYLHVHRIQLCFEHSSAKLRELAWKAMGEFFTQYFQSEVAAFGPNDRMIAKEACSRMLQSCKDTNSGVRAMSIFAMGNLADAVRESEMYQFLEDETIASVIQIVIEALDDNNDKVVGNAIRCSGHIGCVLLKQGDSSSRETSRHLLELLTDKLSRALTVGLSEETSIILSWKQRSVAKKHGWGACYSIGQILHALPDDILEQDSMSNECMNTLSKLSLCLEHYDILNVKLVAAASDATCKLSTKALSFVGSKKRIVGRILSNAIVLLSLSSAEEAHGRSTAIDERISQGNEALLRHVLRSSSISDARQVLSDDRISFRELYLLYSWMVEQGNENVAAHSFEVFALGLSALSRWSDGVALEQQFSSRAAQMYKFADETKVEANVYVGNHRDDDVDEL